MPNYHLQSHLCSPKNLIPGNNGNAKNPGSLTNAKHNPTAQLKGEKASSHATTLIIYHHLPALVPKVVTCLFHREKG